jgi:hypothetical protein
MVNHGLGIAGESYHCLGISISPLFDGNFFWVGIGSMWGGGLVIWAYIQEGLEW